MSDNNTPALNTDGTLKDASENEWIDSSSEDNPPMLSKSKKRKRPESMDTIHLGRDKNPPPHCEAGKRMKKVSKRGKATVDQLNPQQGISSPAILVSLLLLPQRKPNHNVTRNWSTVDVNGNCRNVDDSTTFGQTTRAAVGKFCPSIS